MTYSRINRQRSVPWWAVFGAPLVGVPMVVWVLALVGPDRQAVGDHEADFAVEQVDIDSVGLTPGAEGPFVLPSSVRS